MAKWALKDRALRVGLGGIGGQWGRGRSVELGSRQVTT